MSKNRSHSGLAVAPAAVALGVVASVGAVPAIASAHTREQDATSHAGYNGKASTDQRGGDAASGEDESGHSAGARDSSAEEGHAYTGAAQWDNSPQAPKREHQDASAGTVKQHTSDSLDDGYRSESRASRQSDDHVPARAEGQVSGQRRAGRHVNVEGQASDDEGTKGQAGLEAHTHGTVSASGGEERSHGKLCLAWGGASLEEENRLGHAAGKLQESQYTGGHTNVRADEHLHLGWSGESGKHARPGWHRETEDHADGVWGSESGKHARGGVTVHAGEQTHGGSHTKTGQHGHTGWNRETGEHVGNSTGGVIRTGGGMKARGATGVGGAGLTARAGAGSEGAAVTGTMSGAQSGATAGVGSNTGAAAQTRTQVEAAGQASTASSAPTLNSSGTTGVLPQTGADDNYVALLAGGGALVLAGGGLVLYRRRFAKRV